jgi:hypothetical protein
VKVVAIALALAAAAGGVAAGYLIGSSEDAEVVTTTVERTLVKDAPGLPARVARTHATLLRAAEEGDYEALRPLISREGFEYTFGGPFKGGAIAYWQDLENNTDQRPLFALAAILKRPYTLSRGIYVWPFAYDRTKDELTAHERRLLAPLGKDAVFVGEGYFGWRAGIEPDGDWVFFVAGD